MDKDFFSTSEAAAILRISRVAVFNRVKKGTLESRRFGRNYFVPHEALLEALGKKLGKKKKVEIEQAIDRAMRDYGETFRLLAKE